MDQIFTEDSEQQLCDIIREVFPWVQKNGVTNITTYTECVEDLIKLLQSKNKNLTRPIMLQAKNVKIAEELKYKRPVDLPSSNKNVANTKQEYLPNKITDYRMVINLLRSKIEEYKTEINNMKIEIMLFQKITNSLKGEFFRLKNNMNLMTLMQDDV